MLASNRPLRRYSLWIDDRDWVLHLPPQIITCSCLAAHGEKCQDTYQDDHCGHLSLSSGRENYHALKHYQDFENH